MLEVGDRIGDWIVDAPIGEGGMGAVFRCHNTLSEKIVAAVKVLKSHDLGESRQRFIREVELLARVQHPAVVRVLGAGEDEARGLTFMAMEYLEGEDLSQRLAKGPLSWDEAARMFQVLGEGLLKAHQLGVVHRDIKPANIMICADGSPRILDFGIAVQQGATKLTREGLVPGTMAYIAPEVFEGEKPDHRADIYALGLVLWESLTGRDAFPEDEDSGAHQSMVRMMGEKLRSEPMDPGTTVPGPMRELVRSVTEPDVDARLDHLEEFVRVLAETGGHELPPRPTGAARPVPRARKRKEEERGGRTGMIVGGVGAVLVALAALAVIALVAIIGLIAVGGVAMRSSEPAPVPAEQPAVQPAGLPGSGMSATVPEEFPFSLAEDASVMIAMKSESDGQLNYVVTYTTEADPGPLVDGYTEEFTARGLSVARSTTGTGAGTTYSVSAWSTSGEAAVASAGPNTTGPDNLVSVVWVPAR